MLTNDILRSVRFILNLSDARMLTILQHVEPYADDDFGPLLKKDDEDGFTPCSDELLSAFLDGLIIERRGRRDDAPLPPPALRLSNNDILKKLRVAFELKQEDIEALIAKAGLKVSSAEVGALFRKPDHKHYRTCGDQFLRNLLKGLAMKFRPGAHSPANGR